MKRIALLLLATLIAAAMSGCGSASEPDAGVPVGKPGDPGPKPTGVSAAGGGNAPAAAGATQTPKTD
jgi:hypothetical protein